MSRHAGTTASTFALVLTATILASSAAQAFGPRPFWPTRPRPTSPMPILLPIPNMDGQPGQEPKLTTTGPKDSALKSGQFARPSHIPIMTRPTMTGLTMTGARLR